MSDQPEDFEKVEHGGGILTFWSEEGSNGPILKMEFSNRVTFGQALTGIHALLPDGIPVGTIQSIGLGPMEAPPLPNCVAVFISSDRDGLFGRTCPNCKRYFRSSSGFKTTICPYCSITSPTFHFLTDAQRMYTRAFVSTLLSASSTGQKIALNIDELGRKNNINTPPLHYTEERQQTKFKCTKCSTTTDIIGQYGNCSRCGHRNTLAVLEEHLGALMERVKNPRHSPEERALRDAEWRNIVRDCVSIYEGFGRDLLEVLLRTPTTPRRRNAAKEINFHNPIKAAEEILRIYDIDIFVGISQEDRDFIRKRFLRRHIYEHRSGIADEEYLQASGDSAIRIGQLLREKSQNVATLISLTLTMARNFESGLYSIK